MNQIIYQEKQLPWAELEKIGLAEKGKLLLSQEDRTALLTGRRTALQTLSNISDGNLHIAAIEVKLSLSGDEKGILRLQAHPVHNHPHPAPGLEGHEAVQLISGEKALILKTVEKPEPHEVIFEYDSETREFIITDPLKITIPDKVNGQELTPSQRERYRKGKEVEMADGTTFRYTGVDTQPLRSNRLLLIASILVDGGLTYLAFQGLRAMAGNKNHNPNATLKSDAYNKTHAELEAHHARHSKINPDNEQNRAYTRSGRSR